MVKKILLAILLVLLVMVGGFVVWGLTPAALMPERTAALTADTQVVVEDGKWLVFKPAGQQPQTALIYYPGGRVDYRAYAPYAKEIAKAGYMVVITPMPLSLAVFSPGEAAEVIQAYPEIRTWAVGGHSLGGAMAANYTASHPDQIKGLVLIASYPAESDSLAQSPVQVLSVYGTRDGLSTGGKIDASKALLPASTRFVAIEGGNHAQFGWYGEQDGDNPAEISREAQQEQTVRAVTGFLASLSQ